MRLIIVDSDNNYLEQFRFFVSMSEETHLELFTYSSLDELVNQSDLLSLDSCLLIHEDFLLQLNKDIHSLIESRKLTICILSEGLVLADNSWERYLNSSSINIHLNEKSFVHKYQMTQDVITAVKDIYLSQTSNELIHGNKSSTIISVYTPYGKASVSSEIEELTKKLSQNKKSLIIHYDPFYLKDQCISIQSHQANRHIFQVNDKQEKSNIRKPLFNLSYLFTQIRRKKKNLSLLMSELVIQISTNVDVLMGPSNMLDIDCINSEEMKVYLNFLQNESHYEYIFLNLNGLHITKHINQLLETSKVCVLMNKDESVQLSVTRQTKVAWTIVLNNLGSVIKEVLKFDISSNERRKL